MLIAGELTEILAAIVVVAILFLQWRKRRVRCPLDQIPGPPTLLVLRQLMQLLRKPEGLVPKVFEWVRDYGPVLRLEAFGVKRILLTGAEEIEVLLSSKENITKDSALDFLHSWLGTGLLASTGNKWRSRRKMLTPAFHYKNLEDYVSVFNANSAILVAKLGQHVGDDYVEIEDYASLCTLDIVCESTLGTSVGAQEGGGMAYVTAVRQIFEVFMQRHMFPWLHLDFIYRLTHLWKKQQKLIRILHEFSEKIIADRRLAYRVQKSCEGQDDAKDVARRLNFLDILIDIAEREGSLTNEDIREEVDNVLVAGHDTTAAAIYWTLLLLGSDQDVQDKVVEELSDIFRSDRRQPTMADLQNMTYLGMVIKESLRLFPTSPNISRETLTELKIGRFTIPRGSNVIISIGIAQRNPDLYPDPERFDPERFSPEQTSGRHPCAYIPFSSGPRNCIGQAFARLELKCVLASILRTFQVESLTKLEDVKLMPGVVLRPKDKIKIRVSYRNNQTESRSEITSSYRGQLKAQPQLTAS